MKNMIFIMDKNIDYNNDENIFLIKEKNKKIIW